MPTLTAKPFKNLKVNADNYLLTWGQKTWGPVESFSEIFDTIMVGWDCLVDGSTGCDYLYVRENEIVLLKHPSVLTQESYVSKKDLYDPNHLWGRLSRKQQMACVHSAINYAYKVESLYSLTKNVVDPVNKPNRNSATWGTRHQGPRILDGLSIISLRKAYRTDYGRTELAKVIMLEGVTDPGSLTHKFLVDCSV